MRLPTPTTLPSPARRALGLLLLCGAALGALAQDKADHPLLSRFAGMEVGAKSVKAFDVVTPSVAGQFAGGAGQQPTSFEGKVTRIDYLLTGGEPASEIAIYRNYLAAAKKLGGRQLNAGFDANSPVGLVTGSHVFTLSPEAAGPVAILDITSGYRYQLTIVEPAPMAQSVKAGALADEIKASGHATLHIQFDTDKAVLKSDGLAAVREIVVLLKNDPALKLSIEGHTDNAGTPAANLALSLARAQAVMKAVAAEGIGTGRLSAAGKGQTMPVADNRTEAGRAQNRRVELVKTS